MATRPSGENTSLSWSSISLRQLQFLVALAEHGHFGRAARACHVTQPALSEQIRRLEDALGVTLVDRSRRGAALTEIGRLTADRARVILRQTADLVEAAHHSREMFALPIRLGVIPTVAPYYLPGILPRLRREHPRLQLFLREDLTARLLDQLHEGRLDLALLALPVRDEGLQIEELMSEDFVFVAPPGTRWNRRKRISTDDLAGQDILLLEEGHCLRDQALEICGPAQAVEQQQFRAASLGTLVQMVANGLGATLLPQMALGVEVRRSDRLIVLPFRPPVPKRRIGLVWRRGAPRLRELQVLLDFFRRHTPPRAPAGHKPRPAAPEKQD
ncbi:MAG: LysR substrate-binding domain-containing protein [Candidatus Sumerlaeia bacterium]